MAETKPAKATAAAAEPAAKKVVVYKDAHAFEVRKLTQYDWAKVGVEDGRNVEWSAENNFRVPVEALDFLDADQFTRFIEADPRFEVREV